MRLKHISGIIGKFVKEFWATGRPYSSIIIVLENGKEYAAPSHEFEEIG